MGTVVKRARHFITCQGKFYGEARQDEQRIRALLVADGSSGKNSGLDQISLFDLSLPVLPLVKSYAVDSGEF